MHRVGKPFGMPGVARVQIDQVQVQPLCNVPNFRRNIRGDDAGLDVVSAGSINRTGRADKDFWRA